MQKKRIKVKKKFTKKKKIWLSITVILLGLIGYGATTQIVMPHIEAQNPISIMLVGTDAAEVRDDMWGDGKATLTDSIMVLTFNPSQLTIESTSIPRDTSVDYMCPGQGKVQDYQDQINELYYLSGNDIGCLQSTVENLLNVPIDHHVMVNMDQLPKIVDTVGGVEITAHAADGSLYQENLTAEETYTWYDGEKYTMMGDEALSYARARHDSEKDYGRGLRQQQVIAGIMAKLLEDKSALVGMVPELLELVQTDMEPYLGFKYFEYFNQMSDGVKLLASDEKVDKKTFSDSVWLNIFKYVGQKDLLVTQETVDKAVAKLREENKKDPQFVAKYFFKSHQFYNEAYDGHYNIVESQLQEISDALRKNLGLNSQKAKVPSKSYGDNESSGLIPVEWAVGSPTSSSSDYSEEPYYPPENTQPEPVQQEPEPQAQPIDTDGDGITDDLDLCVDQSPVNDEDSDGCEDEKIPVDTDGDGITDDEEISAGTSPESSDTDSDGILDPSDSCPLDGATSDLDGDGCQDDPEVLPPGEIN